MIVLLCLFCLSFQSLASDNNLAKNNEIEKDKPTDQTENNINPTLPTEKPQLPGDIKPPAEVPQLPDDIKPPTEVPQLPMKLKSKTSKPSINDNKQKSIMDQVIHEENHKPDFLVKEKNTKNALDSGNKHKFLCKITWKKREDYNVDFKSSKVTKQIHKTFMQLYGERKHEIKNSARIQLLIKDFFYDTEAGNDFYIQFFQSFFKSKDDAYMLEILSLFKVLLQMEVSCSSVDKNTFAILCLEDINDTMVRNRRRKYLIHNLNNTLKTEDFEKNDISFTSSLLFINYTKAQKKGSNLIVSTEPMTQIQKIEFLNRLSEEHDNLLYQYSLYTEDTCFTKIKEIYEYYYNKGKSGINNAKNTLKNNVIQKQDDKQTTITDNDSNKENNDKENDCDTGENGLIQNLYSGIKNSKLFKIITYVPRQILSWFTKKSEETNKED
ncbi:hypothetical protein BDAP_002728 [Binucleata daphniae]